MTKKQTHLSIYESLLKSIEDFISVEKTTVRDKAILSTYIEFLKHNEIEICKFGQSMKELQTYLDQYDFTKGFQFDDMQGKLEKLHPLRIKLVKMGEEAKKLSVFPDRYNSKKAIEICKGLTLTCMERMSLNESEKVSELVETNTKKLLDLQKLFERDENILRQIKDAIDSEKTVLKKYKAYFAELREFVSGFPHQGVDDFAIVKNRITVVKQIDVIFEKAEKALKLVLGSVTGNEVIPEIVKYKDELNKVKIVMQYAEADSYKAKLNEIVDGCAVLLSMNEVIKTDKGILCKYKAFWEELQQYISGFPHTGQDDFSVVKERISMLKKIDTLCGKVEQSITTIRNYADRYNKGAVVARFDAIMHEMIVVMHHSDISRLKPQLEIVLKQSRSVFDAFKKEAEELNALKSTLMLKQPEVWKEDNEQLLAMVTAILNKDTRKALFDIGQLKNDLVNAKMKRTKEIDYSVKQHPWLERNKKYYAVHQGLLAKHLASYEYRSAVGGLQRKRMIRIILTFIPVFGWLFMPKIN